MRSFGLPVIRVTSQTPIMFLSSVWYAKTKSPAATPSLKKCLLCGLLVHHDPPHLTDLLVSKTSCQSPTASAKSCSFRLHLYTQTFARLLIGYYLILLPPCVQFPPVQRPVS